MKNKLSITNKITGFIGFLHCRQLSALMRAETNYSTWKPKCQIIKKIQIHRLFLATKVHKGSQRKEYIIDHPNEKFLEVQKGAGSPDLLIE